MTGKRECRVSSTNGMNAGRLVVDRYDVHLRARDHDVAHGHLRDLQRAFDDRQRIGVEELALERAVQQLEQLFAVLRLARQERRQPFEQRRFFREPGVTVVFGGAHRLGAARVSASPRAAYGSATPSAARIATSRALHPGRLVGAPVVVTLKVQHAVNHEMGAVRGERLALLGRLLSQQRRHSTTSPCTMPGRSSYANDSTLVGPLLRR